MGSRVQVETILVQRQGKRMTFVGMAITIVGTNASLNDPIAYAVRMLGGTVANPVLVADADIDPVIADADAGLDALLDVAELRLLLSIKGNLDTVDITSGPFTEKYSQLGSMLDKDIDRLKKQVEQYGISGIDVRAGVIEMNIGSRSDDPDPLDTD